MFLPIKSSIYLSFCLIFPPLQPGYAFRASQDSMVGQMLSGETTPLSLCHQSIGPTSHTSTSDSTHLSLPHNPWNNDMTNCSLISKVGRRYRSSICYAPLPTSAVTSVVLVASSPLPATVATSPFAHVTDQVWPVSIRTSFHAKFACCQVCHQTHAVRLSRCIHYCLLYFKQVASALNRLFESKTCDYCWSRCHMRMFVKSLSHPLWHVTSGD